MMRNLKILAALALMLTAWSHAINAVVFEHPGGGGSGGTGGVLTNETKVAVIANFYTNTTPHWIEGLARLGMSGVGVVEINVTNANNTLFFPYKYDALSVGATSNTVAFKVPPGGWWKFIGSGGTTATDGSQQLLYVATNGNVSFATSAGVAANLPAGTTVNQVNLVAATNLFGLLNTNVYFSTNYAENKAVIYVRDNPSSLVNGTYYRLWTNATSGVWTNSASTNVIWWNEPGGDGTVAWKITGGTNKVSYMQSVDQIGSFGNSGVSFWINPMSAEGVLFGGEANMYWGTNIGSTAMLTVLTESNNVVLPGYQSTNVLRVSLLGDDNLAKRTNGFPFKTLWAANNAAAWGDRIEVSEGRHTSFGIHMKHGTQIVGQGRSTVIELMTDLNPLHATFFQSQLISVWDECTIGNLVISNGCLGFTQHQGEILGGTNAFAHDLWIYPPYLTDPHDVLLQESYFGAGVKISRAGINNRLERVKVYSAFRGFAIQSMLNVQPGSLTLKDCEAICSPVYNAGSTNTWLKFGQLWPGVTNVGGMLPLSFSVGDISASYNAAPFTLNIDGGFYASLNGGTNQAAYVGGETNLSRNTCLWISRGHTNTISINLRGSPQFVFGGTNAPSYAIINEATNNNVKIVGDVGVKRVSSNLNEVGTNYFLRFEATPANPIDLTARNVPANISQSVTAAGTFATTTGSMALMDFGTTDPAITVAETGYYLITGGAGGIYSSAAGGVMALAIATNNVVCTTRDWTSDINAADFVFPWFLSPPNAEAALQAGDTVQLRWTCNTGADYQAQNAELKIIRLR